MKPSNASSVRDARRVVRGLLIAGFWIAAPGFRAAADEPPAATPPAAAEPAPAAEPEAVRLARLQAEHLSLAQSAAAAQAENAALREARSALRARCADLDSQLAQLRGELDQLNTDYLKLAQSSAAGALALADAQARADRAEAAEKAAQKSLDALRRDATRLESRVAELEPVRQQLKTERQERQRDLAAQAAEIERLRADLAAGAATAGRGADEERIRQLNERLAANVETGRKIAVEVAALRDRAERAEAESRTVRQELDSVRLALQAAQGAGERNQSRTTEDIRKLYDKLAEADRLAQQQDAEIERRDALIQDLQNRLNAAGHP